MAAILREQTGTGVGTNLSRDQRTFGLGPRGQLRESGPRGLGTKKGCGTKRPLEIFRGSQHPESTSQAQEDEHAHTRSTSVGEEHSSPSKGPPPRTSAGLIRILASQRHCQSRWRRSTVTAEHLIQPLVPFPPISYSCCYRSLC